jgi:hypothetical protein
MAAMQAAGIRFEGPADIGEQSEKRYLRIIS